LCNSFIVKKYTDLYSSLVLVFIPNAKVLSVKFEVEKFNGKSSFELWKLKMWDFGATRIVQGIDRKDKETNGYDR
jgi:hypothetical protein